MQFCGKILHNPEIDDRDDSTASSAMTPGTDSKQEGTSAVEVNESFTICHLTSRSNHSFQNSDDDDDGEISRCQQYASTSDTAAGRTSAVVSQSNWAITICQYVSNLNQLFQISDNNDSEMPLCQQHFGSGNMLRYHGQLLFEVRL